jgi:hypothetical protein
MGIRSEWWELLFCQYDGVLQIEEEPRTMQGNRAGVIV